MLGKIVKFLLEAVDDGNIEIERVLGVYRDLPLLLHTGFFHYTPDGRVCPGPRFPLLTSVKDFCAGADR